MSAASSSPNFNYGFPTPGPQNPTAQEVMDHVFFTSKTEWKDIREEQQFDYIVIGSGFCTYAFTERILKKDPHAKILILERGTFFLPEHFQNLPLPYVKTLGGLSETFPWTLSSRTQNAPYIKWQHGMVPFFGGRSTLWSGWCPEPTPNEMAGWPEEVIKAAHTYFPDAKELLNVVSADQIDNNNTGGYKHRPIFGRLQQEVQQRLKNHQSKAAFLTRSMPAPLAVHDPEQTDIDFTKFSTPGKLLELASRQQEKANRKEGAPLKIVTGCLVEKIIHQQGKATALQTSRGIVNIGDSKLILATGTLPATTLVQNSFPIEKAGKRFSSHFISAIVARVPREGYAEKEAQAFTDMEFAACYVAGEDPVRKNKGQFHIQLTAISNTDPEKNAVMALRHMPDVVATASMEQLKTSKDHIIFVCAVLGEIDHKNPDNWFRKHTDADPTTNSILQVLANKNDLSVWDSMDKATFETLENILSPQGKDKVEYWHPSDKNDGSGKWIAKRPGVDKIRVPGLVHESSTMHIGKDDDKEAVVGLDYRLKGVENVYITGASLWPTGGSWNPTLTMVALAQHLADNLYQEAKEKAAQRKKAEKAVLEPQS